MSVPSAAGFACPTRDGHCERRPPSPRARRRGSGRSLPRAAALILLGALLLASSAQASRGRRGAATAGSGETSTGETAPAAPSETTVAPEAGAGAGEETPRARERRANRPGPCELQVALLAGGLTAGEAATLGGSLRCATAAAAGEQTVTLYRHEAGTPGYAAVAESTTDASGAFQFTTEALDANSVFYARLGRRRSERVSVTVAPLVTLSAVTESSPAASTARRAGAASGQTVTFSGTVTPAVPGARVILQRESASVEGDWRRIAIAELGADGQYTIARALSRPGTTTIRVVVRARGLLAGVSESLSYQLAPRQNPKLTLDASSSSIAYGHSVVLGGVAAGPAGERLTLLARSRAGVFAPVASVLSGTGGSYEFPAQAPTQSTVYRVAGAGTNSVALSVEVRPLLTAQLASASVQAGARLSVSGTITPARAGQVVFLERQNPAGVGFHVVAAGTVGADGAYTLEHVVSGAGTQVFRVKAPGGGEGEGAASEALEVDVTPPAGGLLEPQAPSGAPEPPVPAEP
jgi:hypothetical protein